MIYIVCLLVAGGVLALDLITKYLAVEYSFNVVIIPELVKFKLTYNTGAAFSFLSDKSWAMTMFVSLTIAIMLGIIAFFVYKVVAKKPLSKWMAITLSLIFSGALGNFVDRVSMGKVRDFIFVFYNTQIFPAIFNVADMALVIGVIMMCVYLLFIDKDAVFKKSEPKKDSEDAENNG